MIPLPSHSPDPREILCRQARQRVRRKARQLIGKAGLRPADREDLEQELTLRLWQALQDFDATLSPSAAFVAMVLDRAANSVLRLRNSRKRGARHARQVPLPQCAAADEDAEGEQFMIEVGGVASHEAAIDLAQDVAAVLRTLPPGLRQLAEHLKSQPITEIAQTTGRSRSTVYARVAQLRAAFAEAGLKNLSRRSYTPRAFCELL